MRNSRQILIHAFLVLLCALTATAQVEVEGVKMGLAGDLEMGYAGDLSDPGGSSHGLGLGGDATLSGSFYNPNFLSFSVQPYYTRAQANADGASVFDTGGYTGSVNLFSGSHFPGNVSVGQVWDSTGIFGIPGASGLTTKDNSRSFGVGWSELIPGMPSIGVSFSRGDANSYLPGSSAQTGITSDSFGIHSGYRLGGWSLGGGYSHLISDTSSTGLLGESGEESSDTSTNTFAASVGHKLPLDGGFGLGVSRTDYTSTVSGDTTGKNNGTTDNAFANLGLKVWRLPVTATASYTDNVYGGFEQQVLAAGGTLLETDLTPLSRSLLVNVGTGYAITPHIFVNGYVNRQELWLGGTPYGLTQLGVNVAGHFGWILKGLVVTLGMNDSAVKQGNAGAGLVANVNYNRRVGRWELSGNYNYNQDVETLLAIYQESAMSYGGGVNRRFKDGLSWNLSGGGGHTAFEQTQGDSAHSEAINSGVSWHRTTLAGNYSKSYGTSVLTPTGLVAIPVPIITNNLVVYNGTSHGFSFGTSPVRNLTISAAYAKANSNTLGSSTLSSSNSLASLNETELYTGFLTYRFRKMYFNASVVQFRQSISDAGVAPSNVTSYYFGISRWFKAF